MPRHKWFVHLMGEGDEVSVCYGDPKNPHDSYGWAGMDKIIVGSEFTPVTQRWQYAAEDAEYFEKENKAIRERNQCILSIKQQMAELICSTLNKAKIKPK